jgi:hypothetical protein
MRINYLTLCITMAFICGCNDQPKKENVTNESSVGTTHENAGIARQKVLDNQQRIAVQREINQIEKQKQAEQTRNTKK